METYNETIYMFSRLSNVKTSRQKRYKISFQIRLIDTKFNSSMLKR